MDVPPAKRKLTDDTASLKTARADCTTGVVTGKVVAGASAVADMDDSGGTAMDVEDVAPISDGATAAAEASPRPAAHLAPLVTLLHRGGVLKRGSGEADVAVTHMLACPVKKTREVLLILHSNGLVTGFDRSQLAPDTVGSAALRAPGVLRLEPLARIGQAIIPLLSATASRGLSDQPWMTKLGHKNSLIVMRSGQLKMFDLSYDNYKQLTDPDGLQETDATRDFAEKIRDMTDGGHETCAVAIHPRDTNLLALADIDGSVRLKSTRLSDHQSLTPPADDADAPLPAPHIFFSPTGGMFLRIAAAASPTDDDASPAAHRPATVEQYAVQRNALAPNARDLIREKADEPEPRQADYPTTAAFEQAKDEYTAAKKHSKQTAEQEGQRWAVTQIEQGRDKRLISHTPLNSVSLDAPVHGMARGHPLAVLPLRLSKSDLQKHQRSTQHAKDLILREHALLIWPHVCQLWCVAGGLLEARATFICQSSMRCVILLTWPLQREEARSAASSAAGSGGEAAPQRFWLVGTADDELHLLGREDLRHTDPRPCARHTDASARTVRLALSQPVAGDAVGATLSTAPLGITSLVLIGGLEQPDLGVVLVEHAGLTVGFEDGSVRQYALAQLMEDLLRGEADA